MSLYQKYNAKKSEKMNIVLLWGGVALGSCSGELVCFFRIFRVFIIFYILCIFRIFIIFIFRIFCFLCFYFVEIYFSLIFVEKYTLMFFLECILLFL